MPCFGLQLEKFGKLSRIHFKENQGISSHMLNHSMSSKWIQLVAVQWATSFWWPICVIFDCSWEKFSGVKPVWNLK
jgi:hypothetical protein